MTGTRQILRNRGLNQSQNIDFRSQMMYDSPKQSEYRIKEATQDHIRDGIEPSRYFSRLEQSNRKQRAIFDKHYLKYIMPTVSLVNAKRDHEQVKFREAKNRMDQLEIEHYNKVNVLKNQYKETLMNQMAEKERIRENDKVEKKVMYDHIEYKRKMYEDEKLNNYIDKKRKQEELRNILEQQSIYKYMLPAKEPSLKTYDARYETNEPDKLYTLGGIKVNNVPLTKGKTRKQNLYLPPNPIVNPMPYFNQYIDPNTNKMSRKGGDNLEYGHTGMSNARSIVL